MWRRVETDLGIGRREYDGAVDELGRVGRDDGDEEAVEEVGGQMMLRCGYYWNVQKLKGISIFAQILDNVRAIFELPLGGIIA